MEPNSWEVVLPAYNARDKTGAEGEKEKGREEKEERKENEGRETGEGREKRRDRE